MYKVTKADLAGKSKDDSFAFMFTKGLKLSDSNKAWAEFGDKNMGGVFQKVLDFIALKPQTGYDLAEYILTLEAHNEARWFSNREVIRKMGLKIFNDPKFVEKDATEGQKAKFEKLIERKKRKIAK
jgi:hypothetical protein